MAHWPKDYTLNGWLINMTSGGELAPHMHENGWISGAVYINIPMKTGPNAGNFVVCYDDEVLGEGDEQDSHKIINAFIKASPVFDRCGIKICPDGSPPNE